VAVARVEVAVVVSGMVVTGPRSAAALSMPGPRPAARPAVGGGGANGWAGGTKLVTPGAVGIEPGIGAGRGVNSWASGGWAAAGFGTAGGLITAAVGGGANMLIAGAWAGASGWAGTGDTCWTAAIGWAAGAELVTDEAADTVEVTALSAAAGAADAGDTTAIAPDSAACNPACIPLKAAPSATDAAAIASAAGEPPDTAGNDGVINAAPKPSNAAP
jgi:hypothetical protein